LSYQQGLHCSNDGACKEHCYDGMLNTETRVIAPNNKHYLVLGVLTQVVQASYAKPATISSNNKRTAVSVISCKLP
jgi:hypothetical protein